MGHWYDKDGNPRHHEGKDNGDTTLREARKLDLYPSVTTVGGILHKQGLVYWLQQEAAKMAAHIVCIDGNFGELQAERYDTVWTKEVIARAKEKTDEKADAGTEIHDVLEKFHDDPFSVDGDEAKMCYAIMDCIKENTGLSLFDDFTPEARFCRDDLGYAGMCDLHTHWKKKLKEPWTIDYKSKDASFFEKPIKGWPEQAEQLVAYSHGLFIPDARTANIFISRSPPENESDPWLVKFLEHKDKMAWHRFRHTLRLWQVTKKYGPYYEKLMEDEDD